MALLCLPEISASVHHSHEEADACRPEPAWQAVLRLSLHAYYVLQSLHPAEESVMEAQPLIVHLMALRKVIIICLAAVVVLFLIVFFGFSSRLVQYVSDPLAGQGVQVIYTEVSEAFGAQTKLSLG